jgi:diadenosine tetraphosphate (Ap4A) HIT family hydrolase
MVREDFLLYEDAMIRMHLSSTPSSQGHIEVRPVKKCTNLSELEDDEITHLFFGASYAATALFEMIGAQGTNIIINENEEQLCVNVIARKENDGLNFLWKPKQGNPTELGNTAKEIKDKIDEIKWEKENPEEAAKNKKGPGTDIKSSEVIKEETNSETGEKKTNFLIESLRRIP